MEIAAQQSERQSGSRNPALLAWPWVWAALALLLGATVLAWRQEPLAVPPNRAPQVWSFFKPIELHPYRRLLSVSSELRALSFNPDGKRGWAVGEGGVILATRDGGQNWTPQLSNTEQGLHAVTFEPQGRRGWAVGDGEVILATSDGGQNWALQPGTTGQGLPAATVPSQSRRDQAVAGRNTIQASGDGAKAGRVQTSQRADSRFYSGAFLVDALSGWVVGAGGAILATRDGGQSWQAQSPYKQRHLRAVAFAPDGRRGWAVGDYGTIRATSDAGQNWTLQSGNTAHHLHALAMTPDGQRAWAVGDNGIILATADGGKRWDEQTSGTQRQLRGVHFAADGRRGWAVGEGGSLLMTGDGGQNWREQASSTLQSLSAVAFQADGLRGWMVGSGGVILATRDGGLSWNPQTDQAQQGLDALTFQAEGQTGLPLGRGGTVLAPGDSSPGASPGQHYRRYPAPWYWVAVALAMGMLWLSWVRRPTGPAMESVADVAASDAEIRQPADDRLDFSGLARGISRFLRNTETRPPLTLAVTGDWGSGKSSLMRLVCADLQRFGHRPIWFNAWHHQKEEHLFAALLGAVHAQAVPPLLTLDGLVFRLRLLWLRSREHFATMMLMVAVVSALLWLSVLGLKADGPQGWFKNLAEFHQWAAGLGAAATAAWALFKGTKVFGVNPALLMTRVKESLSLKAATAQNDFRATFAHQFGELAKALPYRLVIVIDDLDRCRPSAVLDLMEAVNFLTSAGECFVIFGMATERVQAALGLAFKDIAAEMVHMEAQRASDGAAGGPDADPALGKRRHYAADYLQKLVNIEIKVPTQKDLIAHRLLVPPAPLPRRRVLGAVARLGRLWPLAAAAVAVGAGIWFASIWANQAHQRTPEQPVSVPAPAGADAQTTGAPAPMPRATAGEAGPARAVVGPRVTPGEAPGVTDGLAWLALAWLPALGLGALIAARVLRKTLHETHDSQQFRDALEIWTGLVAAKRNTPRAIKRFGNRIRYLAMLQQGEARDETPMDLLWQRWRAWLRGGAPAGTDEPAQAQALAEHQLIGLGALYEVWGQRWNDIERDLSPGRGNMRLYDDPGAEAAFRVTLDQAIQAHRGKFNTVWPPSAQEWKVFDDLISGMRLAGDPQTIAPVSSESDSESWRQDTVSNQGPAKKNMARPAMKK